MVNGAGVAMNHPEKAPVAPSVTKVYAESRESVDRERVQGVTTDPDEVTV